MPEDQSESHHAADLLQDIRVTLRVCVGTIRPTVNEMLSFDGGTVLLTDRRISDEVELFVGDRRVATGILEEEPGSSEGRLQVRITTIDQRAAP